MQLLRHILVTFVGLQAIVQALELATGEDRVVMSGETTKGSRHYHTLNVYEIGDYEAVRFKIAAEKNAYVELRDTPDNEDEAPKRYIISIGG